MPATLGDSLRGVLAPLVTPFDMRTGDPSRAAFQRNVDAHLAAGLAGVLVAGSSGEAALLDDDERSCLVGWAREAAGSDGLVLAGVGAESTRATVRRARAAADAGADAVLVVAPFYNKPTQSGLYAHFRAVAESIDNLPVVIYNVPGRTSSNIAAETALSLARDVENIVAVKEASGDLSQIMAILRERPENFRVLSGDDALTLPLIALGADGVISVASNEAPGLMARLCDLALAGSWDEARALHFRLLPLMEVNFIESSPGPVKAALRLMNLLEENFRLPLVPIQEKSRARVREVLEELELL
jgi:4-hydroxy-tetrahydrodipicolinate synthase